MKQGYVLFLGSESILWYICCFLSTTYTVYSLKFVIKKNWVKLPVK